MNIRFTKMHGLGNDFVVVDAINQSFRPTPEQLQAITDRRFGIGCDQLLLIEKPQDSETDFYYRIYNADGSEVEQCGNGARCFARFVRDKELTDKDVIHVGTASGNITLYIEEGTQVRVNMGVPRLVPSEIPFTASSYATEYPIQVGAENFVIGAVSMGNPHAVLVIDNVNTDDVARLGPQIENHVLFPNRVNAGFMAVKSSAEIDLRVHERGAGETLACGTGACAAVVSGRLRKLLDEQVRVNLPGGSLMISWQGEGEPVWMTGPTTTVFEGSIDL